MKREARIASDGFGAYNIWQHSAEVRELYRKRARDEVEEMTCAAQAAELLAPLVDPGDTLLDIGCGSGYFFHSLRKRGIAAEYYGIDATRSLVELGWAELPRFGLLSDRLSVLRIEDLNGNADHVLCMNVLSNIDNFFKPLERMLKVARKSLILRESIADSPSQAYVRDRYLDAGVELNVYVNTYSRTEMIAFIRAFGFTVREEIDRRTEGRSELVIGYPHHWTFLVATRN